LEQPITDEVESPSKHQNSDNPSFEIQQSPTIDRLVDHQVCDSVHQESCNISKRKWQYGLQFCFKEPCGNYK
jgi:hypothetical protein